MLLTAPDRHRIPRHDKRSAMKIACTQSTAPGWSSMAEGKP